MLTPEQTDIIIKRVKRENIHYSHLAHELIDHICCEVEYDLNRGALFAEALKRVETRIGNRGLKIIQEDTLFLIDKNYRIMKNLMKTTGIIAPALVGLGSLFKIMHWPGASILLVLGIFVLCFMFFPASTFVLYKESKNKFPILLFISGFLAAFLFSLGILWKVQHWPGAGILMVAGNASGILLFLPLLFYSRMKNSESKEKMPAYIIGFISLLFFLSGYLFKIMHWPGAAILLISGAFFLFYVAFPIYGYKTFRASGFVEGKFIFLVLASVWVIITTSMISIKVSSDIFNKYELIYQNINKGNLDLLNANTAIYAALPDSLKINHINNIKAQSEQITNEIDQIKSELFRLANNNEKSNAERLMHSEIPEPDNRYVPFALLVGEDSSGKAYLLKELLITFISTVNSEAASTEVSILTSQLSADLSDERWAGEMFLSTLAFSVNYLSLIEQKVLLIESEVYIKASARNL